MRKHKTNRRRRNWTAEENAFLRANYGKLSRAEIARRLGRREKVVAAQELLLGLRQKQPARRMWSVAELEYLQTHYGKVPVAEIAAHLGRAPAGVALKAGQLGLTRPYAAREKARKVRQALTLHPGDEIEVHERRGNAGPQTRRATVLGVYDHHVVVRYAGQPWRESILLCELVTGEVEIRVLGRRSA